MHIDVLSDCSLEQGKALVGGQPLFDEAVEGFVVDRAVEELRREMAPVDQDEVNTILLYKTLDLLRIVSIVGR